MVKSMKKLVSLFIFVMVVSSIGITAQEKLTFSPLMGMNNECYNMASTNNGKFIYKSGGAAYSFKGNVDVIESYNPADDMWTVIGKGLIARKDHNMEYVPSENKIYIFNGSFTPTVTFNPSRELYSSRKSKVKLTDVIEIIDLTLNKVSILESNPYPVTNAGSAVWNNKIYFFGGWNPMGNSEKFYEYTPAKDDWKELPEMPEAKNTTGKIVDGVLYTFGGYDNSGKTIKTIHAYDFKTEKWSLVGELPVGVSSNAIASDGRNIWMLGSYDIFNIVMAFDTKTKTVTRFESNLEPRKNAAAEVVGNILYVFGGNVSDDRRAVIAGTQCVDISKYMKKEN